MAVLLPCGEGFNVAAMTQVAPAATVTTVRQSVPLDGATRAKSPGLPVVPSIATLVMVSGPVPEFVNVEVDCVLVTFNGWFPNAIGVGSKPTPGCVPFPVKLMICVVGVALSVIVMVAVRLPVAVGVNVAATLQLALATRVLTVRQSVPLDGVASAKSPAFVPPRRMLEILSVAFPVFVKVTTCCPLVWPVSKLPNAIVVALKPAAGCIAVPFKVTVCGLFGSESEIVRVAVRLVPPVEPGLKITFTTQVPVVAGKLKPLVHELAPREKSPAFVPVIAGVPETVTAADVGLLSVTACGALEVPTA